MSDQEKIWFIYLTDHHEGPFTAAEIAEKAQAGLVTGQSLAWKDGMPEWVPAETIPELQAALQAPAAAGESLVLANDPPPAEASATEEVSLAQLLSQTQKEEPAASLPMEASPSPSFGTDPSQPSPHEEVWTLKMGTQVSGLYSLNKLKSMASAGEITGDAMIWHPGWTNFQALAAVPELEAMRKPAKAGAAQKTQSNITRPGFKLPTSVNPDSDLGDEEPTDTGISAPVPKWKALLAQLQAMLKKIPKKKAASAAAAQPARAAAAGAGARRTPVKRGGGGAGAMGRVGLIVVGVVAVAAGAYFFFFSSVIPSSLDVSEDDRAALVAAVKAPGEPKKLAIAVSRGTEDAPADPAAPKYYVASGLPEGSNVTVKVTGIPGTLVNRLNFEKSFSASIDKHHIATFEQISDSGKPLWGKFHFKVMADGADALELNEVFIGNKGAAYNKRLTAYKDSVQGDYLKELDELKEMIGTLKNLQAESSKKIAEFKVSGSTPAGKAKLSTEWHAFSMNTQPLLSQIIAKAKERQQPEKQAKYHARAFNDVLEVSEQLQKVLKLQGDRLTSAVAEGDPDNLNNLVEAAVTTLSNWHAQAVVKDPFDPSSAMPAAPAAPAAAAPAAPAAPAPAAPTAAAPAAPAAPGGKP